MELKDILVLGLTADDFDTLIEGLDAIPEKGLAGDMMTDIMMSVVAGPNRSMQEEIKRKAERRLKDSRQAMKVRQEDLTMLKAKLISLKRLLLGNEGLRQTEEILRGGGRY